MMDHSPIGEPVEKKPLLAADGTIIPAGVSAETASNLLDERKGSATLTTATTTLEILPVIYDLISCVEKDPLDNTAKQRESAECSQKILELQKRFEAARAQIKQLPGIDFNKEEQLQKLEQLKQQLKNYQTILSKYKDKQF